MQLGTELERLVDEVARLAGESRREAVRRALEERRERLAREGTTPGARLRRVLEEAVWPEVPPADPARPWTRADEDALLGYGEHGA